MAQDMATCRKDVYDWQRRSRDTWLKDLSVSFDDVHGESRYPTYINASVADSLHISSRYCPSAARLAWFLAAVRKPSDNDNSRTIPHTVLWHTSLTV